MRKGGQASKALQKWNPAKPLGSGDWERDVTRPDSCPSLTADTYLLVYCFPLSHGGLVISVAEPDPKDPYDFAGSGSNKVSTWIQILTYTYTLDLAPPRSSLTSHHTSPPLSFPSYLISPPSPLFHNTSSILSRTLLLRHPSPLVPNPLPVTPCP